ncbi:Dbl homology domain-containing protein [Phlegmacium glaucopus]|nr:Dbl homology domain-containing protein [Phlegmacium glaucopus]
MLLNHENEPQSPKRVAICAFLPLPSVAASPICTPTASFQIHSQCAFSSVTPTGDTMTLDTSTTPCSGCASMSMTSLPPNPTWIATPPTPPYKNMRRCNTVSTRRSSLTLFTPSTSFPTVMHVSHAENGMNTRLKRCTSVPSISLRLQTMSKLLLSGMDGRFVDGPNSNATFSMVDETLGPESDTAGSRLPSKLFHLSSVTDNDDDGSPYDKDISCLPEVTSPEGSWSDCSVDDFWVTERNRDIRRKFHALKELLATEVGYLKDLKALVTVYLRNLPTLAARALPSSSTFGRASSSFATGPWIHSYTQLQATALSSSTTLPEAQNTSSSTPVSAKESSKIQSRYLFTDSEIEALTRNAEEILQLHEHFVRELRAILEPLSFAMDQDEDDGYKDLDNLDAAIRVVSTKFATEASRFNAYQSFCAGHPEALGIVRKALQQFPLEFDAFEQRCATMVSDILESGTNFAISEPGPNPSCDSTAQSQSLMVEDRKRAMSLTSLDGTVRPLRSRPSMTMTKDSVVFPSDPRRDKGVRRIAFSDYLIKPIQRICKYPLLLDQLLPSKALRTMLQTSPEGRSDVHVVVESAAQAMRHVASSVDEARHRQDIATQSSLIFSRISLGLVSTSALPSPLVQMLTQDFLSSLGVCLLSGSLDVMHYHPTRPLGQTSNIKAKYMGAFLYSGGYLILVKVCKGRKYVPRHWFSLIDFEVSDVDDDGAMLPCSFRLSSGEQHFELAAACKREKESWLCSINESLTHVPAWTQEPTPSFKFDGKGELLPGSDDGYSESPSGLPTIRSIPELGNTSETEFSEPFFASLRGHVRSKKKRRGYEAPRPPSRRSSSTSVKGIFSPISDIETVVIRRSSPTARLQVDQELQDVISQSCLTARSYAFTHEQELFQAPKATFSRSNSGMSMAGMGRLSKHESVRVPRRKTTESFDSLISKGSSSLSSTTTSNKRIGKKLSITPVSLKDYDSNVSQNITGESCPSPPSSRAATLRSSDDANFSLLAAPLNNKEASSLRPRSFVRNVKDLFHFRPMSPVSPVSVIVSHPSQNTVQSQPSPSDKPLAPNTISPRWKVGSLRRRARSVPSEPDNNTATIPDDPAKSYSTRFAKAPLST